MKIKMPLKARITTEYLLNLIQNIELTDEDIRSITNTIDVILDAEDVDGITYDNVHAQIIELIK